MYVNPEINTKANNLSEPGQFPALMEIGEINSLLS